MGAEITKETLTKLTKDQLIHLFADALYAPEDIYAKWEQHRKWQTEHPEIKCWDCEGIAKDLES